MNQTDMLQSRGTPGILQSRKPGLGTTNHSSNPKNNPRNTSTSKYLTENPSQIPQVYPIGCVLEDAQDKAGFLVYVEIHLDACQLGN